MSTPQDPGTEITRAIVFADVSASMHLYKALGDAAALTLISTLHSELEGYVRDEDGQLVKSIGDAIMCAFPSSEQAIRASVAMQQHAKASQCLMRSPAKAVHIPLTLRIGVHWGPVVNKNGDYFGETVNIAARVQELSTAGRVIATRAVIDRLSVGLRMFTSKRGDVAIKGVPESLETFEIFTLELLKALDTLKMIGTTRATQPYALQADTSDDLGFDSLRLACGFREYLMEECSPSLITIGRSSNNFIVIEDPVVSAYHCAIERRGGAFVLMDSSSNGTFVGYSGIPSFRVRKEVILRGEGVISFGRPATDSKPIIATFTCEHNCETLAKNASLRIASQLNDAKRLIQQSIEGDLDTEPSPIAWLRLLELLKLAGDRAAFDRLVVEYAARFEDETPVWENLQNQSTQGKTAAGTDEESLSKSIAVAKSGVLRVGGDLPEAERFLLEQSIETVARSKRPSPDLYNLFVKLRSAEFSSDRLAFDWAAHEYVVQFKKWNQLIRGWAKQQGEGGTASSAADAE